MKTKLITILYLLLQLNFVAQSDAINQRKYWFYRARLTNDFMKIGRKQGESLPMSHRAKFGAYYGTKDGYSEIGADAVSQLGPYICVLATEYKLLTDNSNDPHVADSTIRELYYALEAFNRLDSSAEAVFGYPSALDGFFIRQDVPRNFVFNNINHFNYDLNLIPPANLTHSIDSLNGRGFCSPSYNRNIIYDGSNYSDTYANWQYDPTTDKRNSLAMSLDQCINMYNACALINKYIATGVSYDINGVTQHFKDGEPSIRIEARNISTRMSVALSGGGDWRILIPGGNHVDQLFPKTDAGGNAFAYSYALAEANCKLHNTNTPLNSAAPCLGANNITSATAGWITWVGLTSQAGVSLDLLHSDNAPKTVGLQAACNCNHQISIVSVLIGYLQAVTSYIIGWIKFLIYGTPIPQFQDVQIITNATEDKIEYRTSLFHLEWGSLLRKVLHGGNNLNNFDYANFLNSAPCKGPSYYVGSIENKPGWTSRDNIDHPQEQADFKFKGEFNGLDYMLYHNLYYIDNPSLYTSSADNRYANVTGSWPISSQNNLGSNANPLYLPRLENILANNIINAPNPSVPTDPSNGNVSYRAGKVISLKPGFSAKAGSTFHGYIQRFFCGGGNDPNRVLQDTLKQNADYSDTNFEVQTSSEPKKQKANVEQEVEVPLTKISDIKKNTPNTNLSKKTTQSNKVSIYPNPSNGIFTINLDLKSVSNVNITVTDLLNNEVFKQKAENSIKQFEIDLRGYSKGVYLINVGFGEGSNLVQKLIVQ